jgi:hypothetical protein
VARTVPPEALFAAPRGAGDMASDDGLGAHLRACRQAQGALDTIQEALLWLHGFAAPRLVSSWLVVLLLATLAS